MDIYNESRGEISVNKISKKLICSSRINILEYFSPFSLLNSPEMETLSGYDIV